MKCKTVVKKCKYHGNTKYVTYPSRPNARCRKCVVDAVTKRRRKVKDILVKRFGGKCTMCGYDKCIGALVFHHPDPKKKEFGISSRGLTRSLERAIKEAEKCKLV
jgi:hypothetical protein